MIQLEPKLDHVDIGRIEQELECQVRLDVGFINIRRGHNPIHPKMSEKLQASVPDNTGV